jgi:hypothetical protein
MDGLAVDVPPPLSLSRGRAEKLRIAQPHRLATLAFLPPIRSILATAWRRLYERRRWQPGRLALRSWVPRVAAPQRQAARQEASAE